MLSLVELFEQIRAGQVVDESLLDAYLESGNQAERFLLGYARATLAMRQARTHLLEALRATQFGDAKVLKQFLDVSQFNQSEELNAWALYQHGRTLTQRDWPAGLAAIQDAVRLDLAGGGSLCSAREVWTEIGAEYERAAKMLGRRISKPRSTQAARDERLHIGYLASAVVDDSAAAEMLLAVGRHLDPLRAELRLYLTESSTREPATDLVKIEPTQGSQARGDQTLALLSQRRIEAWTLPGGLDVVRQARMLVERMNCDHIDVLLVDAPLCDAAAWIAVANRAAPAQVALVRRRPVAYSGVDHVVFLNEARHEADQGFWSQRHVPTTQNTQGIDTDLRTPAAERSANGVPADAVLLMTHTSRPAGVSRSFLDAIVNVLQQHPQAVYLLSGDGDFSMVRRHFDAAGLGKRVGIAGRRRDLTAFTRMCDVYVAEFAATDRVGLMHAAATARPIVALPTQHNTAELASLPQSAVVTPGSVAAFTRRISQLIHDASTRAELGQRLLEHAAEHFSLTRTAQGLISLAVELDTRQQSVDQRQAA